MKQEYIYALKVVGFDPYFYVGRTNDLARRMREHRLSALAGDTETKYQVIRDIYEGGDDWEYTLLATVTEADQDYEDFYVYQALLDGHPLANMKQGDAKQAAQQAAMDSMRARGTRYSDARTFLDARAREVQEAAARAATARLHAKAQREELTGDVDPERMLFATFFETEKKFVSPGLRDLQKRRDLRSKR